MQQIKEKKNKVTSSFFDQRGNHSARQDPSQIRKKKSIKQFPQRAATHKTNNSSIYALERSVVKTTLGF